MKQPPIERLMGSLGHSFNNREWLDIALTHRSIRKRNNERLEFLGDSILNFLIAQAVYQQYPDAKEGELSRLRANLVKGETLAEMAQAFNLGDYLNLGPGELHSGGFRRKSILADALEAVIAAIYLDAGMETCRACVLKWYGTRLQERANDSDQKDPKTRLQEYLQSKKLGLPLYTVLSIEGEAHQQSFHVACRVDSLPHETQGTGATRRYAEQNAAQHYLDILRNES